MSTDCAPSPSPEALAASADRDGVDPCAPAHCAPGGVTMDPPPPCIMRIECTQAIQRTGSTRRERQVPLIARKELIVRVFLSAKGADWGGRAVPGSVDAALTAGGAAIPGLFISGPIDPAGVRPDREEPASSINIVVPDAACRGRVAFALTLSADSGEVLTHPFTIAFLDVPQLPVDLVPVELILEDEALKATKPFPRPQLSAAWGPLGDIAPFFPAPGLHVRTWQQGRKITSEVQEGFADANADLRKSDIASTSDRILIGVVDAAVRNENVSVLGLTQGGVSLLIDGSALLVAHEIGHILGRLHTPGSNQVGMDPDYPDRWPDIEGTIEEVGFTIRPEDPSDPKGPVEFHAFDATSTFDYMGRPDDTEFWTSAYGYERVLASMRRCGWRRRGGQRCDLILDVEVIGEDELLLRPSFRILGRPPRPLGPETPFTVEQRDARDVILRRTTLHSVECPAGREVGLLPRFVQAIPWHPLTRALSVSRDGEQIARFDVGNPPAISDVVLDPAAGARNVRVSWTLDDAADVFHLVRYTPDDGATWYTVAVDLGATSIDVDLNGYPGGTQCRFEISASRDAGTTTALSSVFTLDPLPPAVGIAGPANGATFSPGDVIALSGWAFSPDVLDVPDELFRWTAVDAVGEAHDLGAGRRILVHAASLEPGAATITLDVDGDRERVGIEIEGSGGD